MTEGGACGSGEHELVFARVMVRGHLWNQREKDTHKFRKVNERKEKEGSVHVDEPLALVLTPTCQGLFWVGGGLEGRSSDVLERGGLGTKGDGTKGVPCTGPGYNEEVEFDLELPGVT
jgi:hypothetical protein